MERALIVKKEWLDKIFFNGKILEMRCTNTSIRGRVGLIESGSGLIVGEVTITDSFEMKKDTRYYYRSLHQVKDYSLLDKWRFAWVLESPKKYKKPIPYKHPQGAVIWVKL